MNLQSFFQDPPRLLVGQTKDVVDRGCIRPKDAIDEPDRKDRIDRLVLVSRLDLAGVEFASVEDEASHQALVGRQLNLDVVNRPRAIDRLDVELGLFQLVWMFSAHESIIAWRETNYDHDTPSGL